MGPPDLSSERVPGRSGFPDLNTPRVSPRDRDYPYPGCPPLRDLVGTEDDVRNSGDYGLGSVLPGQPSLRSSGTQSLPGLGQQLRKPLPVQTFPGVTRGSGLKTSDRPGPELFDG